jgi:DNA-binding NarL/FixJ family response regulator
MNTISILIADDNKFFRSICSRLLQNDDRFTVVKECDNGEDAVAQTKQHKPKIVLMDIEMPVMNGFEATSLIQKSVPESRIIGFSSHEEFRYAEMMVKVGAQGYISKNATREELFEAILQVDKGELYLGKKIIKMNE